MEDNKIPVNVQKNETVDVSEPAQPPAAQATISSVAPSPKKKSGAGKKIFAVLLVLILIGGAGYAGYYYANQQAQKDQDAKVAEIQGQLDQALKVAEKNNITNEQLAGVLVIKEWGVVFPVESPYTNLAYKIEAVEGTESASIVAAELIPTGTCAGTKGEIGTITRSKTQPTAIDGTTDMSATKVGDYYYSWASIQNVCNSKADLEQAYVKQLESAVKNAEAVDQE